jgi:hypothetical protein
MCVCYIIPDNSASTFSAQSKTGVILINLARMGLSSRLDGQVGGRTAAKISPAPQIADSVDVLETGLDLPEAVNLIFPRGYDRHEYLKNASPRSR